MYIYVYIYIAHSKKMLKLLLNELKKIAKKKY